MASLTTVAATDSALERSAASWGAATCVGVVAGIPVAHLVPGDTGAWLGVAAGVVIGLFFWRAYRLR